MRLHDLDPATRAAIGTAEAFVRDQGYTDQPAGEHTPVALGPWDCLSYGGVKGDCTAVDTGALLQNRHGTLDGDAKAFQRTDVGWVVFFRVATSPADHDTYLCAAVRTDAYPVLPEQECHLTAQAVRLAGAE
ncbi:MAG: hypothetical protein GC201_10925 [Alphaproteobacteria bacterium]|nr:hypothetical protein [Alphaproteobacteria bacterium]